MSYLRQIRDVQVQADKLISENVSMSDLEAFDRYSLELKNFLLERVVEADILQAVREIPSVETSVKPESFFQFFLSLISSLVRGGLESKATIEAKESVRDVRNKYASIEFLMRGRE